MDDKGLSRSQLVYARLKQMIREGTLRPGQRMRENEIAEMQGVSRTPVREAVNLLLAEGLLEVRAARGIVVTELSKQQVLEIYALREFLEGAAARFASQHASLAEMRSLDHLLDQAAATDDVREHALMNKRFHTQIAEAGHNNYLGRSLLVLSDALLLVPGTTYEAPGRIGAVQEEHRAIVRAIFARDAQAAEDAARQHIRNAGEVRLQLMFGRH